MLSRLDHVDDWLALATKADFQARTLAGLCNVSLRQLERYCRTNFLLAPQEWLNQMRLDEALMLLDKGFSVKETAYKLGFKQTSHFCRLFKQKYRATPRLFRAIRQQMSLQDNKSRCPITHPNRISN